MTGDNPIAEVVHYYNHLHVAVIRLESDLRLGDLIHFVGAHTDFGQEVTSLQIDHHPMMAVRAGHEAALLVRHRVRPGDLAYRATEVSEDESPEWFGDLVPEE